MKKIFYLLIQVMLITQSIAQNNPEEVFKDYLKKASAVVVIGKINGKSAIKEVLFDDVEISKLLGNIDEDAILNGILKNNDKLIIYFREIEPRPMKIYDIRKNEIIIGINQSISVEALRKNFKK